MKFRNCFIDEKGRIFKDTTLRNAAKALPVKEYQLTDELLDEVLRWKLSNFHDYLTHFKRVVNADLAAPIIIRSDGLVMDGRHRILKAFHDGVKTLPSQKFTIDPEPDFDAA